MTTKGASAEVQAGGDYTALLAELDTFSKAQTVDADAAKAAAADPDADPDAKPGEGEAAGKPGDAAAMKPGEGDTDDDADGEMFGKSFAVVMEDGTAVEAYDGTAMMKALHAENVALKGQTVVLAGQVATLTVNSNMLLKALTSATGSLKQQGEMLKSLAADVVRIGSTGTGRRAVLNVHEKTHASTTDQPEQIDKKTFMAKAMTAFEAGKVSGDEIRQADARLARGAKLDGLHPDFVARVMGATG